MIVHESDSTVSEQFLFQLVYQLSSAIDYMSDNGVVHRNICASNILVDNYLKPVLTGFGWAMLTKTCYGEDVAAEGKCHIGAGNLDALAPELMALSQCRDLSTQKVLIILINVRMKQITILCTFILLMFI